MFQGRGVGPNSIFRDGVYPEDGKWMSGRRIGLADRKKRFKKIGLEEGQHTMPPDDIREGDGKPPFSP